MKLLENDCFPVVFCKQCQCLQIKHANNVNVCKRCVHIYPSPGIRRPGTILPLKGERPEDGAPRQRMPPNREDIFRSGVRTQELPERHIHQLRHQAGILGAVRQGHGCGHVPGEPRLLQVLAADVPGRDDQRVLRGAILPDTLSPPFERTRVASKENISKPLYSNQVNQGH